MKMRLLQLGLFLLIQGFGSIKFAVAENLEPFYCIKRTSIVGKTDSESIDLRISYFKKLTDKISTDEKNISRILKENKIQELSKENIKGIFSNYIRRILCILDYDNAPVEYLQFLRNITIFKGGQFESIFDTVFKQSESDGLTPLHLTKDEIVLFHQKLKTAQAIESIIVKP